MKYFTSIFFGLIIIFNPADRISDNNLNIHQTLKKEDMTLGAFSNSLAVKDIHASKAFYEKLGFHVLAGDLEKNYLIMKNGNALIGIFQGMFEGNTIQKTLKSHGQTFLTEADESTTGPASFMITDPDGNMILVDQHR